MSPAGLSILPGSACQLSCHLQAWASCQALHASCHVTCRLEHPARLYMPTVMSPAGLKALPASCCIYLWTDLCPSYEQLLHLFTFQTLRVLPQQFQGSSEAGRRMLTTSTKIGPPMPATLSLLH